jgi:hypothetical protein
MKRVTAAALLVLLAIGAPASALGCSKAAYVGGTIARFDLAGKRIQGCVEVQASHFVFVPENSPEAVGTLRIDYASILHLEFGQRASRRLPLAVAATAIFGPLGLLSLRAKSRAHYLTLTYAGEEGSIEVVVIELGKDAVRSTLAAVEARSGNPVEYQDEEARKWMR